MRAFLSHASADKELVLAVHDALEPLTAWLDRAEIELGDLFLEKIEDGIRNASDFVLFWSKASAASEFVRLEVHMAFIQALESRAIRLRVIRLDDTPLPLRLKPSSTCRSSTLPIRSPRLWMPCGLLLLSRPGASGTVFSTGIPSWVA